MPNVVIIAGPNGAGKSTLAPALLRDTLNIPEYVNADTIAEGLSAFAPEDASFDAGRVMLRRLHELASIKKDFAFETTLATRSYAQWLKRLKAEDYRANLIFLWWRMLNSQLNALIHASNLAGIRYPRTRYVEDTNVD